MAGRFAVGAQGAPPAAQAKPAPDSFEPPSTMLPLMLMVLILVGVLRPNWLRQLMGVVPAKPRADRLTRPETPPDTNTDWQPDDPPMQEEVRPSPPVFGRRRI